MRRGSWVIAAIALCACERANRERTVEMPMPKVTVRVVDPGAEPWARIRNTGTSTTPARYKVTRTGEITSPQRRPIPALTITYESGFVDVSRDGVRHTRQRTLTASDGNQVGFVFDSWRDDRGAFVRPSVATLPAGDEAPDDGEPELMTRFPDDAVGVGARWHEDVTYKDQTASVDIELLARDGDHVRERVSYHVEGETRGTPAHRDGTAIIDAFTSSNEGSLHQNDTVVIDYPRAIVRATVTTDVVTVP